LRDSHSIWNAISALEDPWYKVEEQSLEVIPLTSEKENNLKSLIVKYDDLREITEKLIQARKEGNWKVFLINKEQIAQKLRPIWRIDIEKERERKAKEGWVQWIKNNVQNVMNRMYNYFFPTGPK